MKCVYVCKQIKMIKNLRVSESERWANKRRYLCVLPEVERVKAEGEKEERASLILCTLSC